MVRSRPLASASSLPRHAVQNAGSSGFRTPPSRSAPTSVASPVASSISTARPEIVAGPDAGSVFPDLKVVMDRLLALRGDDPEIQQLHALWTAATEAFAAGNVAAAENGVNAIVVWNHN